MPTSWSFEVPIKHLHDFSDLQDFHFSLSMLYEDLDYRRYMRHQKIRGLKTLWIDNSFNEKFHADSSITLAHLAKDYEADKVIAPDDPSWSIDSIREAFLSMCSHLPSLKVIAVCNSPLMMKDMILHAGANHIALSYWVRPKLTQEDIEQMNPCHFLGLLNPEEIRIYRPPSCDTSMPIKIAIKGWSLQEWIDKGCPHINTKDLGVYGKDFFKTQMDDKTLELARKNIKDLKEVTSW